MKKINYKILLLIIIIVCFAVFVFIKNNNQEKSDLLSPNKEIKKSETAIKDYWEFSNNDYRFKFEVPKDAIEFETSNTNLLKGLEKQTGKSPIYDAGFCGNSDMSSFSNLDIHFRLPTDESDFISDVGLGIVKIDQDIVYLASSGEGSDEDVFVNKFDVKNLKEEFQKKASFNKNIEYVDLFKNPNYSFVKHAFPEDGHGPCSGFWETYQFIMSDDKLITIVFSGGDENGDMTKEKIYLEKMKPIFQYIVESVKSY